MQRLRISCYYECSVSVHAIELYYKYLNIDLHLCITVYVFKSRLFSSFYLTNKICVNNILYPRIHVYSNLKYIYTALVLHFCLIMLFFLRKLARKLNELKFVVELLGFLAVRFH